eukprot:COSAG02_NODE_3645_length_6430_cov_55.318907_2_plen_57_part_00
MCCQNFMYLVPSLSLCALASIAVSKDRFPQDPTTLRRKRTPLAQHTGDGGRLPTWP